jgi:replicative DNA helicase
MEAFKESGAVEYSSDVLLGLQLQGAGSRDMDVNAAKAREPRAVELVVLKNRNGVPYAKLPLRYYAKYNLFEEDSPTKAPPVKAREMAAAGLRWTSE